MVLDQGPTPLYYQSKRPFGYSFIYFPPNLGKVISPKELDEMTEVTPFVEGKLKTKAHRANQTIDVGLVENVVAENLSVKPNPPLLITERDYRTRDGLLMFVTITYFRPDLYKYRIDSNLNH